MEGHPVSFVNGHNRRGLSRPDLGDGRYITTEGYVAVYVGTHPLYGKPGQYAQEHRLVIEEELGHRLPTRMAVHHLNGIKTDNRRENLIVLTRFEHGALHGRPIGSPRSPEERAATSANMKRIWAERKAAHQ